MIEQAHEFAWSQLLGPLGGAMAIVFGSGIVIGYAIALKTVLSGARARIEELRAELALEREARKEAQLGFMNYLQARNP